MKQCFYCGKDIKNSYSEHYLGLDIPYINLIIHSDECWDKIVAYGEEKYLQENKQRIFDLAKLENENAKSNKKRGKMNK